MMMMMLMIIQSNFSTTATLGKEKRGCCGEVGV